MKAKIKDHIINHNRSLGYGITDLDLIETLQEGPLLSRTETDSHRWWQEYEHVVSIGGVLIGFITAETTGDMTAKEAGFKFDLEGVQEMVETIKTLTVYIPK